MKKLLVLSLALTLAACSDSGDKKKKGSVADEIPTSLEMIQTESNPLSEAQVQEFSALMKSEDPHNFGRLVLGTSDETTVERNTRLQRRNTVPAATKALITDVEAKCQLVKPVSKVTETGRGIGASRVSENTASFTGEGCPVTYISKHRSELVMLEATEQLAAGTFTISIDMTQVAGPTASQVIGSRAKRLAITMSGPFSWNPNNELNRAYVTGEGEGHIEFLTGPSIPLKISAKVLITSGGTRPTLTDMAMVVTFVRDDVTYVMSILEKTGGGRNEKKLTLNGREMPPGSLGESFDLDPKN